MAVRMSCGQADFVAWWDRQEKDAGRFNRLRESNQLKKQGRDRLVSDIFAQRSVEKADWATQISSRDALGV
jgi:hypothetical protein